MDSFETARLTAERLHARHLADLVALHLDPEVSRYLGGVRSPAATEAYLAQNLEHWDRHGFGLWGLRTADGAFVGRAGVRHLEVGGRPEVEIAYSFTRQAWGRGFASEIAAALIAIGLERLALPSLVGVASLGNAASRRVLVKSGFAFEAELKHHGEDVAVYRRRRHGPPPVEAVDLAGPSPQALTV